MNDHIIEGNKIKFSISRNEYKYYGPLFSEIDNYKSFYNFCKALDRVIVSTLPGYAYIKFFLADSGVSPGASIEIYSDSGIGNKFVTKLSEALKIPFKQDGYFEGNTFNWDRLNIDSYLNKTCIESPKMEFSIIPRYQEYSNYLASKKWIGKRNKALELAEYKCSICGTKKNLCVHHLNYNNIGDERQTDLFVLCTACHKEFHN